MNKIKFSCFSHCFCSGIQIEDIILNTDERVENSQKEINYIKTQAINLIDKISESTLNYHYSTFVSLDYFGKNSNKTSKFQKTEKLKDYINSLEDSYDLIEVISSLIQMEGKEESNNHCDSCGDHNSSHTLEIN